MILVMGKSVVVSGGLRGWVYIHPAPSTPRVHVPPPPPSPSVVLAFPAPRCPPTVIISVGNDRWRRGYQDAKID